MDEKGIQKISNDQATPDEQKEFDALLHDALIQAPSIQFTDRVMEQLKPGAAGVGSVNQLMFVLVGVILAGSLWLFGGLGNETPDTSMQMPTITLPAIDYDIVTKGFGFAFVLLSLLFIERVVNRKRMAS